MKLKSLLYQCFSVALLLFNGCKQSWLEIKPDKSLSVPETLNDLQAILDDQNILNRQYAIISNAGTDNVYVSDADAGSLFEYDRDQHIWSHHINWLNESAVEWNHPYTVINSANIVLDGLAKLNLTDFKATMLKGQALFYRSYAYYTLAQVFCKPYQSKSALKDLGIPIRIGVNVNEKKGRQSLEDVYTLMVNDLEEAIKLLPIQSDFLTRTNSTAASALLAKVYLTMGNYTKAKVRCDSVLVRKSTLIDYNNSQHVSPSRTFRFPVNGIGNPEILFYAFSIGGPFRNSSRGHYVQASEDLYNLYEDNDLRKELNYTRSGNRLNFVGNYTGTSTTFSGIALNETYLIRAECNLRLGMIGNAQSDLNTLLIKRFKTGSFHPILETNPNKLMRIIINERRKELPRHGNSRWEDLRRFNLESEYAVSQIRTFMGQTYTLEPNSPRYVLNIPNNEIRISGIEQNKR